ncbi:MAG TPA: IPT/TIG domain-containing protein [Bryobacteraceae bacterium]|nr:IPT/TIG domain-containing protein [Bryobacteraceae bacterium]
MRLAIWFCACNLVAAALSAQCSNPTQVPSQTVSSGAYNYSDNNALSASSVVINGSASMTFAAGNCIQLLPGFDATAGTAATTFHAWVEAMPSAVSVSPSGGTGLSQAFTWTVSSPSGYGNLSDVFTLFNTSISGANACYIHYNRASNLLYLADNTGSTWLGGFVPGSSGSAGNPQCSIYGSESSVSASGSQLSVTVSVTFQASFAGAKNDYVYAVDNEGLNTTWQQMGTWTVENNIPAPPNVTGVTPTSGAAGTQVTISGSGFGAAQGSGTVWVGSTLAAVASWSDTQVIATVASNSRSGTIQVQQAGVWSNSMAFNVSTATVSSVMPASGLPGTQVTIAGSGFGASQGSGQVWLGTAAAATVQSWSDTQVVAIVAAGSASGNAQILQNGVMSNPVPFTVSTPQITTVSPNSGAPGTSVTITGSGFGAAQGSGSVLLGSINGLVTSWSDTQIVASVATGSLSGLVRVQQSGFSSNAIGFKVPAQDGSTLTLAPDLLSLVVGDTASIQALDSTGKSVTGLTWASSDTNVVTLSTDDPPILTAVAAGHATITAGSASADVTVYADTVPVGTILWSNPGNGSGVSSIVPAVPSLNGVADVFGFQNDGTVQAITADGITAWSADVSQSYGWVLPDFQGGLVAMLGRFPTNGIEKLDGMTGQAYPAYTIGSNTEIDSVTIHPDGTIFALIGGSPTSFVGIDPTTGAAKFNIALPDLTDWANVIVAGDGYAYLPYVYYDDPSDSTTGHLKVLRADSSGANQTFDVNDWTGLDYHSFPFAYQNATISSADDGILLSWWWKGGDTPVAHLTKISSAGVSNMNAPILPGQEEVPISPVLQREDGSFVGTALIGENGLPFYDLTPYMFAFDANGQVLWSVANEQPQTATADNGLISQSGVTYDQSGNATGKATNPPVQSWTGNLYQNNPVAQVQGIPATSATTWWAFQGGNPSGNNTAAEPLPDRVNAVSDVLSTDPLTGAALREIVYMLYQGTHQIPPSKSAVISEKLLYSPGNQQNPPSSSSNPGQEFDDQISTRNMGNFNVTQQFFVSLPGVRKYRVQTQPCTSADAWGSAIWQNIIRATSQTISLNGDSGSSQSRSCSQ